MAGKLFSERSGIIPEKPLQIDNIDQDLRNQVWSILFMRYFHPDFKLKKSRSITMRIWAEFFKQPIDDMPSSIEGTQGFTYIQIYKDIFFHLDWYRIYDLLEFIVEYENQNNDPRILDALISTVNGAFEEEKSAFRFVDTTIVKIVDKTEISEIEESLERCAAIPGAQYHIKKALSLLSKRENPDYPNSIKESVSAVEAMCRIITGDEKASLGKALDILKKSSPIAIHGSLLEAWKKLYGYGSDSDGIRHAAIDFSHADYADAKFMVVSCSAFVNHLIVKANDAEIKLKYNERLDKNTYCCINFCRT